MSSHLIQISVLLFSAPFPPFPPPSLLSLHPCSVVPSGHTKATDGYFHSCYLVNDFQWSRWEWRERDRRGGWRRERVEEREGGGEGGWRRGRVEEREGVGEGGWKRGSTRDGNNPPSQNNSLRLQQIRLLAHTHRAAQTKPSRPATNGMPGDKTI